jgi:hypothetical protein
VVDHDAPRALQRDAEEHVVGDEVRDAVALVRGAGDARPGHAAPLATASSKASSVNGVGSFMAVDRSPMGDAVERAVHVADAD